MAITDLSAQQGPTTGYAPVNGLKMYYEVHGRGEPVVLLHGAFMTITNNWEGWIGELSKTRKVIAVEMQGHGRTADIARELSDENHADDVAALADAHVEPGRREIRGADEAVVAAADQHRVVDARGHRGFRAARAARQASASPATATVE